MRHSVPNVMPVDDGHFNPSTFSRHDGVLGPSSRPYHTTNPHLNYRTSTPGFSGSTSFGLNGSVAAPIQENPTASRVLFLNQQLLQEQVTYVKRLEGYENAKAELKDLQHQQRAGHNINPNSIQLAELHVLRTAQTVKSAREVINSLHKMIISETQDDRLADSTMFHTGLLDADSFNANSATQTGAQTQVQQQVSREGEVNVDTTTQCVERTHLVRKHGVGLNQLLRVSIVELL